VASQADDAEKSSTNTAYMGTRLDMRHLTTAHHAGVTPRDARAADAGQTKRNHC